MIFVGANPPKPRLCYLYKVEDFDGYGFNLEKRRGRDGQYIGNIELGSPADRGGLRDGDRVVEVNGENIETKSHKKVVKKIKDLKGEVSLLLVDAVSDEFIRNAKIKLTSKYPDVVVIHSSKTEELLEDVDVDQFDNTEVQSVTLKIEDLQDQDEGDDDEAEEEQGRATTMKDLGYDDTISERNETLDDVAVTFDGIEEAKEENADENEETDENNAKTTKTTIVIMGQEMEVECDVTDADGESIKEVNGDWKLTSDELDAEEVVEKEDNDLLDSVSTSSLHSPSEVKFKKKI